MKRTVLLSILQLSLTGCASMHRLHPDYAPKPPPPYWATGMDLGIAVRAPFGDGGPGGSDLENRK